jgi:lipid-binding SYLF domain-containing protein
VAAQQWIVERRRRTRRTLRCVDPNIVSNKETWPMSTKPLVTRTATVAVTILTALIATVALAAVDTAAIDKQVAATLDKFYSLNPKNKGLVDGAAAVLVFPSITKAGIGIGGEHGDGALLEQGKTVGYYSVSGASIGLTLGVAKHSQVILFNTPEARDKFVNGKDWSMGADTSVAVVKTGAGGTYDTQTLQKPVLAFVFGEKGLMGDASLTGAKISRIATK